MLIIGDKGWVISLATRQAKAQRRAADLTPIIEKLTASGAVFPAQTASELDAHGINVARGRMRNREQVRRALEQPLIVSRA